MGETHALHAPAPNPQLPPCFYLCMWLYRVLAMAHRMDVCCNRRDLVVAACSLFSSLNTTTWKSLMLTDNSSSFFLSAAQHSKMKHSVISLFIGLCTWKTPNMLVSELKKTNKKSRGFPGGLVDKNLPANAGDTGWIPSLGRSHGAT